MNNSCRHCGNELYCNRCVYCSFECTYDIPINSEDTRIILPNPKDVYKKIFEESVSVRHAKLILNPQKSSHLILFTAKMFKMHINWNIRKKTQIQVLNGNCKKCGKKIRNPSSETSYCSLECAYSIYEIDYDEIKVVRP